MSGTGLLEAKERKNKMRVLSLIFLLLFSCNNNKNEDLATKLNIVILNSIESGNDHDGKLKTKIFFVEEGRGAIVSSYGFGKVNNASMPLN